MKKFALHWQILIAIILAVIFGVYFKEYVGYVAWMGDIFLRSLKMIIIPLILFSLITGVGKIGNSQSFGRLSAKTLTYYLSTSLLAIITGLILVNTIQPGTHADLNLRMTVQDIPAAEHFGTTLIQIIPDNIFSNMADNGKMLSVIFFALLFGFFITRLKEQHQSMLTNFFEASYEVIMKITLLFIRFTPFGIFGLLASKIAAQNDLIALFQSMGLYMMVVLLALFIHACISLPLLLTFLAKVSPLKHFLALKNALITAFSTSSSGATLPLTIECVKDNSGVSDKITNFTLPLGATINMDGTALYECVAVMFIAQAYGVELSFMQQLVVVFTALLASVGAAAIPMAGLIMMTIILSAVGLPLEGIGLIIAVDRILDMFRTTVNVWSDSCGAVIIAKSEGETLKIDR